MTVTSPCGKLSINSQNKKSAIPTLKDCENIDKAEALASHFEHNVKEKVAIVKDFQDDTIVNPILDAKIQNFILNFRRAVIDKTLKNIHGKWTG
jgi:hypothetical protein